MLVPNLPIINVEIQRDSNRLIHEDVSESVPPFLRCAIVPSKNAAVSSTAATPSSIPFLIRKDFQ